MGEPTVWDYFKEKLTPWKPGTLKFPEQDQTPQPIPEPVIEPAIIEDAGEIITSNPRVWFKDTTFAKLPFRSLAALLLAILAQAQMEPPDPAKMTAVTLYILAVLLAGWAIVTKEWQATDIPDEEAVVDDFNVNTIFALASLPIAVLTFITFDSGLFTPISLLFWAATLLVLCFTFYRSKTSIVQYLQNNWVWIKTWPKQPKISPWTILFGIGLVVIVFFRFYHLSTVPLEMTSDHAEKLEDVKEVLTGLPKVFFERNTGREWFQFYLTAGIIKLFGTGLSFMSLKIGTALAGICALPFIYLLGKEIANKRVGFIAVMFAGISYWPNVISRVGLRFPLYPLFAAPALYFFIRGLRRKTRNDFIWAGICVGLGLSGYSPFRIMPVVLLVGAIIYAIFARNKENRLYSIVGIVLIGIFSFAVFLPLFRYMIDNPDIFLYRTMTRISDLEQAIPGNPLSIFFNNLQNALLMFAYSNGDTWLHSIPYRPAVDIITGGLFYLGALLILIRFFLKRSWLDLYMLLLVPLLMLPSILSLAFPLENPSLNRTSGAIVPVFIMVGYALDGVMSAVEKRMNGNTGRMTAFAGGLILFMISANLNFDLVFNKYADNYRTIAGNTTEIGGVIRTFATTIGDEESAWVVGYPYWVDTRLVSITAGYPIKDYAIWPDKFAETKAIPGPKLFIFNPEDIVDLETFQELYPLASVSKYNSAVPGKDFLIMFVPPES